MTVVWKPEGFNARLKGAFRPAAEAYGRAAQGKAPGSVRVSVSVIGNQATATAEAPGGFLETGTHAHTITPKAGTVLRLADGRFVTGPVRHPGMRAQPFLRPTLSAFPAMFRATASGAIRGFGAFGL